MSGYVRGHLKKVALEVGFRRWLHAVWTRRLRNWSGIGLTVGPEMVWEQPVLVSSGWKQTPELVQETPQCVQFWSDWSPIEQRFLFTVDQL